MADRNFRQFINTFEARPVLLFANLSIGATGAVTLNANSRGIASVTRTGVGAYTITLQDTYTKLLMLKHAFITSTGTDAALQPTITADGVASATPTITVVFRVAAGTATEISNGAVVLLELMIRNSSAPV